MQQATFELGPGAVRSAARTPFEIPWEQWQSIHIVLVDVNGTSPETTAQFVHLMPAYAGLRQAAGRWRASTFPNLIGLSQAIVDYNRDVVQVNYPGLDAMASRWQTAAPSAADKATFDRIATASTAQAQRNGDAALPIVSDLQALTDAVQSTSDQSQTAMGNLLAGAYGGGGVTTGDLSDELVSRVEQSAQVLSQIAAILAVVGTPPIVDVERVRGAWGAISDDLVRLETWLLADTSSEQPFLAQLNVEAALGEWQTLAAEAGAFAGHARSLLAR